jgi:formyltetrahydrofolate-dependent phosphoribosylglycinamide formyltransferase
MKKTRLLFLASGRGSNFAAICDAIRSGEIPGAEAVGLICNKPAPALELAKARGVPATLIEARTFRRDGKWDRAGYEVALAEAIRQHRPDFICLAGYMLLLGKSLIAEWPGKILNIHPSLLPSFKGLDAPKQALAYGVQWTGCTVHFVTEDLDAGPIVAQSAVEILPGDDEASLIQRQLPIEHRTYIQALRKVSATPFRIEGQKVAWLT